MSKVSKLDTRVQEVIDKGVDQLDDIFEMLMDEAKGVYFLVSPKLPGREKPKGNLAEFVSLADEVESVCKKCKQPLLKNPPVVWEVWKKQRDSILLKYLYDQLAGRSKARETEKVDPEIIVVFGDIDSEERAATTNEVKELEGSPPRTSVFDNIPTSTEAPLLGI